MSLPSGSLPKVKMMKAADLRNFDHLAKSGRLDRSAERRIFCKRQMRPATFVVGKIALQSSTQRSAVPHQDVVQAFASDGAHQPFREGILPGRSRRSKHFLHSHISSHGDEVSSVDGIPIAQHISRRLVPRKRFPQLLHSPLLRGAFRHSEVHHLASSM